MKDEREYRPLPFWSWNDKLEKEKLIQQIHWMKENGMGGFFMHARSGLITEYLSKEWMQCIEACAKEAKELDMKAWIYDENGWPSGFVGGKLLHDERNRDKYIIATEGHYEEGATVSYLMTETELVRVSSFDKKDGVYLNLFIQTSTSSADILNPDVVEQFLMLTHEKYKEHFGEHFSKYVEGFFTDEPQYYREKTPYTDMLPQYWSEIYGEDILNQLGLLFVEKEGYRKFRYRFWKAMQELMLDNFAKKVYTWCDNQGVKLTGHYIEEISLASQMLCCGGVMPFYEYEHIPGIDWLGKDTSNELSVKQVASVAAQLDKKRVITETFAACGWDVSLAELRRIASFQYVNGTNMICHHLIPYSERGRRKYDYPAHYSEVNPWVKENFKQFNDYYTKLGNILGEGEKYVNVAMLHPIRSAYFEYKCNNDEGQGVSDLDDSLSRGCRTLSSRGIDFHFLDETLLAKYGFVKDGKIGCGKCVYTYLVFPKVFTMDRSTEALIKAYVKQGGKVLLLEGKPQYVEAEEYDYVYLSTNTSLEEIVAAQPYRVLEKDTAVYSTLRMLNGVNYLYIMNSDENEEQKQTFDFGSCVKSFKKLELLQGTERLIPLTVTLKPGEDMLLVPCDLPIKKSEPLQLCELRFSKAKVSVKENYLPLDYICYSFDGKEFSKPWPYAAVLDKLLRERYEGNIYFRYYFELETVPQNLWLYTEKSNDVCAWLNGDMLFEPTIQDGYVNQYDISSVVHKGTNDYTVRVHWYQSEDVYYALYGEGVTESLRNCLVYDTELQPVELVGEFGVYSKTGYVEDEDCRFQRGSDFYIDKLPEYVTELTTDGFPFLAGDITLTQNVTFETSQIVLRVKGEYQVAFVKVNGEYVGQLFFDMDLDVSRVAKKGENEIEIRFVLSNRNRFGPHHVVGVKDRYVFPGSFEMIYTWDDDRSEAYHADYDIKKFYH